MESEIIVRKNMTLTNEKAKNMCRLNYEDNDFWFTTQDGKCVIIDKSKQIIHIEGNDDNNIKEYQEYLQNILNKRKNKIILTTLSPDTHRTSEENLGLSYLTAVLRKSGYNVEIIDGWLGGLSDEEVLRKILNDREVAVVGVSCYMSNNDKSIELARKIREARPQIKLMCGGFGPSFNPQKFVKDDVFDVAMIGEGEESIIEVTDYFIGDSEIKIENIKGIAFKKDGEIVRTEKRNLISNLDAIPFPARDTMNMTKDRKSTVNILTARGCMGNCLFCSVNAFNKLSNGRKWRGRSVDSIVDELEQLQNMGVKYIKVIDDSFLEQERDEQWAKEFSKKVKERGIDVSLRGSLKADQVEDRKIKYLKEAGFHSFACGIENGSNTALKRMNKSANLETNKKALDILKKHGIYVQAGYILFDDNTTFEELKENYDFLREYDWIITKGIFSEMFAADGTLYTEKLKKEDKIVKNDVYDNNKYEIIEPKVKLTYNALKRWHKSHMKLYDMIIDPISSPKAIDSTGEKEFYDLYYQLKLKDLDFMQMVLEDVELGISEEQLNQNIIKQIADNNDFYEKINAKGQKLCEKYELNYDGKENPFIR
ncbi:MAG: B12-binding domain-containing radical SAM protein [Clostridia bacterium]